MRRGGKTRGEDGLKDLGVGDRGRKKGEEFGRALRRKGWRAEGGCRGFREGIGVGVRNELL
jgi:hypothetical protein